MRYSLITIALALLSVVYATQQGQQRAAPEAEATQSQTAQPAAGDAEATAAPAQSGQQSKAATGSTKQAAPECQGSCAKFRPPKTPIPTVQKQQGQPEPVVLDHYVDGPEAIPFEFDDCTACAMAARAPSSNVTKKYHSAEPMFIYTSVKSDGVILWDGKSEKCFAQVPVVRVKFEEGQQKQCHSFGFFREYLWNTLGVPRTRYLFLDGTSGDLVDRTDYVNKFGDKVTKSELNVEEFNRDFFTCVASGDKDVRVFATPNTFLGKVTGGTAVFYEFGKNGGETCEMADYYEIKGNSYCLLKLVDAESKWREALFFKSKQGWKRVKPGAAVAAVEFDLQTKEGTGCIVTPRDLHTGKSVEAVPAPGKRIRKLKNGNKLLFNARNDVEQILRVFLYYHSNVYLVEAQIVDHEGNAYNLYYFNYQYGAGGYFQITLSDFQAFRKVFAPNLIKRRTQTSCRNQANAANRASKQNSKKKMQTSTDQAQQQAQASQQSEARVQSG